MDDKFNTLSERKPLSCNPADTRYEVLHKGKPIAKPNYASWDTDEKKFCVGWEGYLDQPEKDIQWRLYKEPTLQSALDTQGEKQCGDVLARLELLQKRAYSHAEKSNGPKEMREWIDSDVAKIRAALTHEAEAVDLDQLYRGAANEDEAICQVTRTYNDGWNAAIDHLASTGRIRGVAAPQSDEKETIAKWMIFHGFTTGHGDTVEGLLNELSWQIATDVKPKWLPIEEWHENDGPAFWTKFPVQEPFYSGSPLDVDWPEDYYTHFIPMRVFYCTLDSDGMPLPQPPAEGE